MSKTFEFEALKRSAGRFNFAPGKKLELAEDEARELLADEAVRPLDPAMPDSFYPTGKAPKPAKKTTAKKATAKEGSTADGSGDGDADAS
jgi:topoisomerase IA-like protein